MADTEGFEEFYAATVGRLVGQLFPVTGDLHFFPESGSEDDWAPAAVAAFDAEGRQVAGCTIGPPWNVRSACAGK